MKRPIAALAPLALAVAVLAAAAAPIAPTLPAETLLNREILRALDEELSGVAAKDHVSRLAQLHRVPASPGFHEAIAYVMDRAKTFGLADVHVETFPGDGTTWFGTLHGSRGWRVDGGYLDEIQPQPAESSPMTTCGSRSPTTARAPTSASISSTSATAPSAATTTARTSAAGSCSATLRRRNAIAGRSKSTAPPA